MPHTPSHFSESDLVIGCPVFTHEGDQIGEVKEVRAGAFKVDASMQPDFWLSTGRIASATTGRLVLDFAKEDLGDYKMDSPDEVAGTTRTRVTETYTTTDRPR